MRDRHYEGGRGIDALGNPIGGAPTYDPHTLEAVSGPASRWDLSMTPAGWGADSGEVAGQQWLRLADQAQRQAEPRQETTRRLQLWRVAKVVGAARYVLIRRGIVEQVPTLEIQTPRRIGKVSGSGGAIVDSFLERGAAWAKLRDSALYRALLEWAIESKPTGKAVRAASDALAVGILARHGIEASASALTHGLSQQG
jgi:hypothetical protein